MARNEPGQELQDGQKNSLLESVRGASEDMDRPGELLGEAGRLDQGWAGYISLDQV